MDFENMNIWCWLIPAAVGLICALFGYLIGKGGVKVTDNSGELKSLTDQNAKLQAELAACNKKLSPETTAAPKAITAVPFKASAAKAAMGKTVKHNDLKIVEGIGPKIEQLFHNYGIDTWEALSETLVAKCQEVLESGGDRYKMHDPASWPMQAKMCFEGKWKSLARWQEEHKRGKL
ncbi:hypothetical protein [Spongiimicrobium sp. 3-5]|uniref:hypothetical protein n=1 Tax=Spongiimicrobium sp. 3-5 TaxID=3332596 RepID=UPI0039808794